MTQHAARSTQHAARSTQHAARSTQHAARGLLITATSSLALALAGCSHDELARTDVHNGVGVATPSMIVIDGTVPGSSKSKLRVDNASVAPLRNRLHQILDLDGRGGHLSLVLNPAEKSVPKGCASGKGRVCLRVVHQLNVAHADSILLLPGLPTVSYDASRVTLPGAPGSFATAQAEFVGIDLTETIPSGAPDQSSELYMLTRLLPEPNAELRLSLHSDKLEVAGHNGSVGLWLPGTLTAAASSTVSEHYCDGATGMGTLEACGEILQKMDEGLRKAAGVEPNWLDFSCKRVDFTLDFRRIRLWLGLVPETTPGCDPLMHRWDLEWMKNTTSPREYRQGCLKVRGSLHASVDAEPLPVLGQPPDADILFSVGVSKCSSLVQAACATVVNCPGKAREITESQLETLIPSRVSSSLDKQLGPIFNYTAGAGSPYKAPPSSPCAGFDDPSCVAAIRQHHLPASLTRLAYGWFGNAFGSFDTTPSYQYPVTSITGQCPTFFTYVRGKDYDLCVNCPGSECSPDYDKGGCYHVFGWQCETNAYPAAGLDFWYALDPDADGHREYADNCPMLSNPSQADKDGDGLGDLCDLCPCTVGPDLDGDGVCADACNGPGDNCPAIPNPNQENCNLDAEVARNAETLGDACDPVPCPRFTPVFGEANVMGEKKGAPYTDVKVQQSLDYIRVEPIGSHLKTATTPTEVPVEVAETHYRYCVDDVNVSADCFKDTAIHDSWLDKASSAALENTLTLWHRVTIKGLGLGTADGATLYQLGNTFNRVWRWNNWKVGNIDQDGDFSRWRATPWGAPWIPDVAGATASPDAFFTFKGRFWIHAATGVGTTDPIKNTGLHSLKNNPNQPADSQSNHYEPLTPFAKYAFYQVAGVIEPLFIDRECYWCGPAVTFKPVDDCPYCTLEAVSELSSPISRVVVKNGDGRVGVVSTSGALSPLRASVSPSLAAKLGSAVLWVDQAEPSAYGGKGLVSPVSVGVSPVDGSLVEQVYSAAGQLLGQADLVTDPGDGVPALAAAALGTSSETPGRSGFIPVYSRSRARVFLVGGSGASGRDVAFRPLEVDGQWQDVPPGQITLGTPVAATFNATDGKLWIMDEIGGPWGTRVARLLTVDPDNGKSELLGQWPRLGLFEQHYLRTDRDGAMLLFASSKKHHLNAVVRLELTDGKLAPAGFRIRPRALALPPVVDAVGYWLVTRKPTGKLDVDRLEDLSLVPALGLAQVGQCW